MTEERKYILLYINKEREDMQYT